MPQQCEIVQVLAERTVATRFELLVSRARRLVPAAAINLSSLQPARELRCLRERVNGRYVQFVEDGDQRGEDRHRFGEDCDRHRRGEDLCVCCEHWQLNRD